MWHFASHLSTACDRVCARVCVRLALLEPQSLLGDKLTLIPSNVSIKLEFQEICRFNSNSK